MIASPESFLSAGSLNKPAIDNIIRMDVVIIA